MTHYMKLHAAPFEMIKSGKKIYELRLYDEKRRQIAVGDEIVFTERGNASRNIRCSVVGLHVFPSFKELYSSLPLLLCGYAEENISSASYLDMEQYYSAEEQREFSVVGIEISLI